MTPEEMRGPVRRRATRSRTSSTRSSAAPAAAGRRLAAGARTPRPRRAATSSTASSLTLEEAFARHDPADRDQARRPRAVGRRADPGGRQGRRARPRRGRGRSAPRRRGRRPVSRRAASRPTRFERRGRRPVRAGCRAGHDRGARRRGRVPTLSGIDAAAQGAASDAAGAGLPSARARACRRSASRTHAGDLYATVDVPSRALSPEERTYTRR